MDKRKQKSSDNDVFYFYSFLTRKIIITTKKPAKIKYKVKKMR